MNNDIKYFNLNKKDDSAIVRILHSTVKNIEYIPIHTVVIDGKNKNVRCIRENCPLCNSNGSEANTKIYIHLFDYTDNCEKVWVRTDKIINQLKEIEENWGNLSECVLKITRETDEFPKYNVIPVNAAKYSQVNKELIDEKIAYRFYMTRSRDELNEYLKTGVMPPHKKKENTPNSNTNSNNKNNSNNTVTKTTQLKNNMNTDDTDSDPFV